MKFAVPAPGAPLFEAATANFDPRTQARVDTRNPDRGPLLIISGETDNTVPQAISHAAYQRQEHNPGVTEFTAVPGREGGIRPHPAVTIERDARLAVARLVRELDLDVSPPASERSGPPALFSNRGRRHAG